MSAMTAKKVISILTAILMIFALAGCGKETADETPDEIITQEEATQASATVTETTTQETTTQETTTVPETTTKPDGSSIKAIVDTLESKTFYLAGTMNMQGGEVIDAKMTCDGDDYRLEMNSSQMKLSMVYLDGNPYIVNNSSNSYILFDQAAIDSLDQVLNSFSSFGVSFSSADMNEMKGMMSDFDQNMDFSQYIDQGEYSEYNAKVDGVDHLCSVYETEYGTIRIYTLDGQLKVIDIYDAEGLRQMNMKVSVFIPQVLTPISLTGLNQSPSILHLFGLAQ
ncbi:MAG: hypothetical protein J6Q94_07770 [Clostridia bacterium]|nr:hypothetical protein [Clostridia bacterium]